MFEVLDFYQHVFGAQVFMAAFKEYPHLLLLYNAVGEMGRLPSWRKERLAVYEDWEEYAKQVDATLGR